MIIRQTCFQFPRKGIIYSEKNFVYIGCKILWGTFSMQTQSINDIYKSPILSHQLAEHYELSILRKMATFGVMHFETILFFSVWFNLSLIGVLFFPFGFWLRSMTFYWACFQFKNSRESIIETGNSYHGVAKCSYGKLCSSCCRTWV